MVNPEAISTTRVTSNATATAVAATPTTVTPRHRLAPYAVASAAYSRNARSSTTSASTKVANGGRNQTVPMTNGRSARALSTRVMP